MNPLEPTIAMLSLTLSLVFNFWPIVLLAPIQVRNFQRIISAMLSVWLILAGVRGLLFFSPEIVSGLLIPEPLNTVVFFVSGPVLLLLWYVAVYRHRHFQLKTMEGVHTAKDLLSLSPSQFEQIVAQLFRMHGYKAKVRGQSGDGGVDVVVRTSKGEKWIVQCKRWKDRVGSPVVRDFYGAMQHEKADRGIIVAVGGFTGPAIKWSKGKPIALYDGNRFLASWRKAEHKLAKKQSPRNSEQHTANQGS